MSDSTLSLDQVSQLPDLQTDDVIFSSARALPGRAASAPTLGLSGVSAVIRELRRLAPPKEQATQDPDEQIPLMVDHSAAVEVAQLERLACPPGAMFWLDEPDLPHPRAAAIDSPKLPLELKDLLGSRETKQAPKLAPAPGLHSLNIELPHDAFQAASLASDHFSVRNEALSGDPAAAVSLAATIKRKPGSVSASSSENSTPPLAYSQDEALLVSRLQAGSNGAASSTHQSDVEVDTDQHSVASLNPPVSQREHAQQLSDALARLTEQPADVQGPALSQQEPRAEFVESPSRNTDFDSAPHQLFDEAQTQQVDSVSSMQQSALPSSSLHSQGHRKVEAIDSGDASLRRAVRAKKFDNLQRSSIATERPAAATGMDAFLLMRGQEVKAITLPPSSPEAQQPSQKEQPMDEVAPASPQSSEAAIEWPRHRYVATSRSLRNHAVTSALRKCNVSGLLEEDLLIIDLSSRLFCTGRARGATWS